MECDEGTSGRVLANLITSAVQDLNLPLSDVRGQCYDGASNMPSYLNGAAALIHQSCGDKAFYTYCSARCLNLCIVSMANVQLVKNMWAIMKELAMFFNMSPKRQQALDDHAKDDETRVSKLVDLSTTRWMARHDALSVLLEVFSTGVSMLKSMSGNNFKGQQHLQNS